MADKFLVARVECLRTKPIPSLETADDVERADCVRTTVERSSRLRHRERNRPLLVSYDPRIFVAPLKFDLIDLFFVAP
jgi:hypothetical protein